MGSDHYLTISRRDVIVVGAATMAAAVSNRSANAQEMIEDKITFNASTSSAITITVNGKPQKMLVDNRVTLLDALREGLEFTGTKKGCDHGQCGACTVISNGRRINSCLSLAVMHDGDSVTTIEGIGSPEKMGDLQTAFVKHDGYQCGYCTPGQICSAKAVLEEIKAGIPSHVTQDLTGRIEASAAEIKERMSGNICRCGAYANILAAIQDVAGEAS